MEDEVVEKLRHELIEPLKTEAQVCYMLVLARKLLEHQPLNKDTFATLQFFCDWALHIKLRKHPAGLLLQEFDREIPDMLRGTHDDMNLKSAKVFKMLDFFLQFLLLLMLNNIDLPNDAIWGPTFMRLYLSMISNCPVTYDQHQLELLHIDKLVVRKQPDNTTFKWELSIKGEPVHSWDVELGEDIGIAPIL